MENKKNNLAIILAAGKGQRAKSDIPKQFIKLGQKAIIDYSIEAFIASKIFSKIIIVLPNDFDENLWKNRYIDFVSIVSGGAERDESVSNALKFIEGDKFDNVFIHDAARPGLDIEIIKDLLNTIKSGYDGALPVLSCTDAMWQANDSILLNSIDRNSLKRAQTPQAFNFEKYSNAFRNRDINKKVFDDAQIAINSGLKISYINGNPKLDKITNQEDFKKMEELICPKQYVSRTGNGFDAHRFCKGDFVTLCGIKIPCENGLDGHSDADVAWHALVDAILGSIGEGDIGQAFPPSEAKWKGADSEVFLDFARAKVIEKSAQIINVDVTIICETPKITAFRDALRQNTARVLQIPNSDVNIKATTTEKMGFAGRKEGIASLASATILMKRGV